MTGDRLIFDGPEVEPIITSEMIERFKAQDDRLKVIDLAINIENELRDNIVLKLIFDAADSEAREALEALAMVDPADQQKILALQAKVYRAKFINKTLSHVLFQAKVAENSLKDETEMHLDPAAE